MRLTQKAVANGTDFLSDEPRHVVREQRKGIFASELVVDVAVGGKPPYMRLGNQRREMNICCILF